MLYKGLGMIYFLSLGILFQSLCPVQGRTRGWESWGLKHPLNLILKKKYYLRTGD